MRRAGLNGRNGLPGVTIQSFDLPPHDLSRKRQVPPELTTILGVLRLPEDGPHGVHPAQLLPGLRQRRAQGPGAGARRSGELLYCSYVLRWCRAHGGKPLGACP